MPNKMMSQNEAAAAAITLLHNVQYRYVEIVTTETGLHVMLNHRNGSLLIKQGGRDEADEINRFAGQLARACDASLLGEENL